MGSNLNLQLIHLLIIFLNYLLKAQFPLKRYKSISLSVFYAKTLKEIDFS